MPIPVFDKCDNLYRFHPSLISSIRRDEDTRHHMALVGDNEYYFTHTIKQRGIIMMPLGFFQINRNEIVNTTIIDKYKSGKITIRGRTYHLSRERIAEFESFYFPD